MTYSADGYYDTVQWRMLRMQVCARDRHICQYCGMRGYQADHVIPRSKGGPDTLVNLVCACRECNRIVYDREFRDFDHKKRWILRARAGTPPEPAPTPTKVTPQRGLRLPPKRNSLRQRLAERNNPTHYQEERLLHSSQS